MCNNNTIKLYDEGVRVMGGTLRLLCYKKKNVHVCVYYCLPRIYTHGINIQTHKYI